jgi:Zn finger protein HypA/HybF involved in hydrogenase expression
MVEHENGTAVASHTEYIRTQVQCVGCGMSVSATAMRGRLCGGCRSAN